MNQRNCSHCGAEINPNDKFCPGCGKSNESVPVETKVQPGQHTISSSGNFSGKLTKGKKSKGYRILRNIILGIILIGVIALIVWFKVDPEAGKKLADVLLGMVFMVVFFLIGWLFMRGKKRNSNDNWDDNQFDDDNDNND